MPRITQETLAGMAKLHGTTKHVNEFIRHRALLMTRMTEITEIAVERAYKELARGNWATAATLHVMCEFFAPVAPRSNWFHRLMARRLVRHGRKVMAESPPEVWRPLPEEKP